MRILIRLSLLAGLAACGAAGPPERPGPPAERPEGGISVSGTASIGVEGNF